MQAVSQQSAITVGLEVLSVSCASSPSYDQLRDTVNNRPP